MAKVIFNAHACKGCGLCVSACPKKIIALNQESLNEKGYAPAYCTEPDKCIVCGFCCTICPDIAITIEE
ncbi:MAG: 4Fe-4S dicluster domain-containing protein [Firmicutes bacterium]|nr:4Fe-4S dicluster domain-containing protein [Bacillota bacterium]MBQ7049542.1 4Fe-4S dicluster domain-containing protein [Bacillota bacterium]MBR6684041.1 4Fe-4S dicluster domain-containing protein [Bacillota bacterium]